MDDRESHQPEPPYDPRALAEPPEQLAAPVGVSLAYAGARVGRAVRVVRPGEPDLLGRIISVTGKGDGSWLELDPIPRGSALPVHVPLEDIERLLVRG